MESLISPTDHRPKPDWFHATVRVILLALILKIFVAFILPLGVDENYEFAVAQEFSWSFLDHPPLGFWLPVLMAKLTGFSHPLVLRLPFLIFGALTTLMIYFIGREMAGPKAGFWAALLHTLAPIMTFGAGLAILPDGPLDLGLALAGYCLVRIVKSKDRANTGLWAMAGMALAVALASKYQAGFMPIGVVIFAVLTKQGRGWFLSLGPYLGAAIGFIGLAPVIWWNLQNEWASFSFHGGRTGDGVQLGNFAVNLLGQGLYLLPPSLVMCLWGLGAALRRPMRAEFLLLAILALTTIVSFNLIYLFSAASFPHWTMPGWLLAFPLAGAVIAGFSPKAERRLKRWTGGFAAIVLTLLVVFTVHTRTGILTRFTHQIPPDWDQTISVFDWQGLKPALTKRGLLQNTDVIMASSFVDGGAMSVALGTAFPVLLLDENQHHFAYMTGANATGRALFLSPTTAQRVPDKTAHILAALKLLDPAAKVLEPVVLNRGGRPYAHVILIDLQISD